VTRKASALLAASLAVGLGASIFFVGPASSNSFSGSDTASGGCGLNASCTADDFTADDATGTGFGCSSTLESCLDTGPGAHNSIGTNASGQLLLGPENDASTVVRIGDTWTIYGNGTLIGTNAAIVLNNNGFLVNQTGTKPVLIDDAQGLEIRCVSSLPTCGVQVPEGTLLTVCASGSVATHFCGCESDGAGTPAYEWRNLATTAGGTASTCP
jgi:hypothetical protein